MSDQLQHTSATPPTDEEVEAQQRAGARRTALLLVLLMLVVAGVAFWYLWNMRAGQMTSDETINVLLLGVTDEATADNVDAIVVASLHPVTKSVAAVALPVNTVLPWVIGAGDGANETTGAVEGGPGSVEAAGGEEMRTDVQLRDVYADGDETELVAAVERLLEAPVHHTVRLDFSGFVELVDLFGTVSVNVLSEVTYRDAEGEVVFHLEPGRQRLSGMEALLYVRYKGAEDESRRVERQWRFVEDVVAEARSNLGWDKVRPLLGLASDHMSTDLSVSDITFLTQSMFDAQGAGYTMHVLPGADDADGWIVDAERVASLSSEVFYNPSWETATQ